MNDADIKKIESLDGWHYQFDLKATAARRVKSAPNLPRTEDRLRELRTQLKGLKR